MRERGVGHGGARGIYVCITYGIRWAPRVCQARPMRAARAARPESVPAWPPLGEPRNVPHGRLHIGHSGSRFSESHFMMQCRWNSWLHSPKAVSAQRRTERARIARIAACTAHAVKVVLADTAHIVWIAHVPVCVSGTTYASRPLGAIFAHGPSSRRGLRSAPPFPSPAPALRCDGQHAVGPGGPRCARQANPAPHIVRQEGKA